MIKLIRLDERLIHGQVATKWSRLLDVNRIIVANDEAANNTIIKQSLMMAAPATAKVAIVTVDKMIAMMQNPKASGYSILVVVSRPEDLLKIVKSVPGIEKINVGNYGRAAEERGGAKRPAYGDNLYLYDDEAAILKEVASCGIPAVYQTTPDDTARNLAEVLNH